MKMISKKQIVAIAPYVVIVLLLLVWGIPTFTNNRIEKGKDLGKVELAKEIMFEKKVPATYTYCPDIDWDKLKSNIRNEIELRINDTNTSLEEKEIREQIIEELKPLKEMCEEKDLHISFIPLEEILEAKENEIRAAVSSEIQENFICQRR